MGEQSVVLQIVTKFLLALGVCCHSSVFESWCFSQKLNDHRFRSFHCFVCIEFSWTTSKPVFCQMSQSENVANLRCVAYFVFSLSKLFQKLQLQSCLAVLTACGVFCKSSSRRASVYHGLLTSPLQGWPQNQHGNLYAVFFQKTKGDGHQTWPLVTSV